MKGTMDSPYNRAGLGWVGGGGSKPQIGILL